MDKTKILLIALFCGPLAVQAKLVRLPTEKARTHVGFISQDEGKTLKFDDGRRIFVLKQSILRANRVNLLRFDPKREVTLLFGAEDVLEIKATTEPRGVSR